MSDRHSKARRQVLGTALGAVALAATARAAEPTPAQTEGPFFPIHDQPDKDADMTRIAGHEQRAKGEVVVVRGRVLDQDGAPVAGAVVDVWQANASGRYAHERDPNPAPLDPDFQGWAKLVTDDDGRWSVRTIVPGAYPVQDGWSRPPHIHVKVARRGFHELTTQMYFAGNPLNDADRLLQSVPEAQRAMLVVDFAPEPGSADPTPVGHFDLVVARALA